MIESWELLSPAEKYEDNEDELEDFLSRLPPLEQPSFGWRDYWFPEKYSDMMVFTEDMFEMMPPHHGFGNWYGWEWGFAIWGRVRFLEWGVDRVPIAITDGLLVER